MTNPEQKPRTRKTKPAPAAAPNLPVGPADTSVAIRMYDVGFGDCFLLKIQNGPEIRKVLFDCGTIKTGSIPIKDVANQVIDDVRDPAGKPRIDVVVCTHRHKDHVGGFNDPAWAAVEVGEVWMPWTEDPHDTQARDIREVQSRLAAVLEQELTFRLNAAANLPEKERVQSRLDMAINAVSNEGAMRTLHQGFAGNPQRLFLAASSEENNIVETPVLPGVTVHVLGPWKDPDVIREMDPPAGESYLKMADSFASERSSPAHFWQDWSLNEPEYTSHYNSLLGPSEIPLVLNDLLPPDDRQKVKELSFGFDEMVAATLDKAVNGTSLVLVLEIGSTRLLFPGDAQWGTWRKVMEHPGFLRLLEEVNFYKVGHHASHNATPLRFVEEILKPDRPHWAMVSTAFASNWTEIPKAKLLEAFQRKAIQFVRSDQPAAPLPPDFEQVRPGVVELTINNP